MMRVQAAEDKGTGLFIDQYSDGVADFPDSDDGYDDETQALAFDDAVHSGDEECDDGGHGYSVGRFLPNRIRALGGDRGTVMELPELRHTSKYSFMEEVNPSDSLDDFSQTHLESQRGFAPRRAQRDADVSAESASDRSPRKLISEAEEAR